MQNRQTVLLSACAAALVGVVGLANAAPVVIVNDTWRDGTRTDPAAPVYSENAVDGDVDGDVESAWFLGGAGTLDPVGPNGPLRGQLVTATASSSTWTTYFTPEASPVTLGAQGDSMKVTWIFTPTTVGAANTSQNFRVALVDSPSASRLAVDGAPGNATYTGYGMFMNMGPTLGNSNPFRLVERSDPTTASALLSSSGSWAGLANGATSGNAGYTSGTEYTFEMLLTRNALDGIDFQVSMRGGNLDGDGEALVVFTDSTPNGGSFSFDTFSIRPSDAGTTAAIFDTRLFRVEYTPIPEPTAAFGLMAAAGLGLVRRRRA